MSSDVLDPARFPLTQWSLVGRAGQVSREDRREALGTLLRRYMPALRAHLVLAKRISPHRVDDLVQGFVTDKIIEQNLLARAEQARGKFRSFLLAALDHYLVGQIRHDTAQKRGGSAPLLNISEAPEASSGDSDPSLHFTLMWARQVVEEAQRRMEAHCGQINRPDLWLCFSERLIKPAADNTPTVGHEQIADALKLSSPKAASNLFVSAKRLFKRILRQVVGEYAGSELQIDEEIDDLMRILSQHR